LAKYLSGESRRRKAPFALKVSNGWSIGASGASMEKLLKANQSEVRVEPRLVSGLELARTKLA
jgi:hypothetical protein